MGIYASRDKSGNYSRSSFVDGENLLLISILGFDLVCIFIGLMRIDKKPLLELKSKWPTEEDYLHYIVVRTFQQL